ncbi:Hypothetical protein LBF_1467 [Leptospira biflexa serovar Patoc strain 'Patoc 1 (Ames)']|jgi:hypothetical protein|uniref:Uncharacterized protein n=1 Tax=Leptospira biflexa serovar Patoc (strain Patoc 1 / ATCC 23582 / Paris) TaxID=456481 RepID=B0SQG9_LEPBP|nr:hypothetical protein [Leptospira biflexa]ABZ93980.1 Hypothetical protein LBF_1467 [Leptospira biflexa serovar Patoc strain 'Patoc 1 (Ames)']ABZ97627.1 Conserved hypothetical protein [Leptospira biflexa serovar Patoc strain 'Patoc 1 (Paris)']TGM34296.1 hypothetical protein EHQ89_13995 [Leptospira biflexa]TGM40048.1 hypothetical protein EHQ80_02340 [Leptospira biflexa]
MGKGYHSRSPEEFRDYLKQIGDKHKRTRWRQIVLFIDLVLVILIFYIGFKALNPGNFQNPTQSDKQIVDGYPTYLSVSREEDPTYQGYFLFIENQTKTNLKVPSPEWKSEFRIKTRNGILCYSEPIVWEERTIPSEANGFLYHSISKEKWKALIPDCRKEIFDEEASIFRSKFRSLDLGFYAQVVLQSSDRTYTFQIKQKPYK